MRIPSHHVSGLRALVDEQAKLGNQRAIRLQTIFSRPARPSPSKKRLAGRVKSRREAFSAIRASVMERAGGFCERCQRSTVVCGALQADHWLGGSGRRRACESVETVWALCAACHGWRTTNFPDAAWWNEAFQIHAEKYGYPFHPHIEHAEVAR